MAIIGPFGELSVIVLCLECGNIVCLDNHTQWLRKLYVLLLFYYFLLFVAFDERRTRPYNQQLLGTDDIEYTEASMGSV